MVLYVLTSLDGESNILAQRIYTDLNIAKSRMEREFEIMLSIANDSESEVHVKDINVDGAELVFGDDNKRYKWYLKALEC
jgi:hypothetical protein